MAVAAPIGPDQSPTSSSSHGRRLRSGFPSTPVAILWNTLRIPSRVLDHVGCVADIVAASASSANAADVASASCQGFSTISGHTT